MSFFAYRKLLPNLINSSWLWWIIRRVLANQRRRNIFEWILMIIVIIIISIIITLQWVNIKKWERGSDGHFHTNHWSLSTRASSWCLCLQECGKGLLLLIYVVKCDYKKNEAHATETKLTFGNSKRRLILRPRLLTSDFLNYLSANWRRSIPFAQPKRYC